MVARHAVTLTPVDFPDAEKNAFHFFNRIIFVRNFFGPMRSHLHRWFSRLRIGAGIRWSRNGSHGDVLLASQFREHHGYGLFSRVSWVLTGQKQIVNASPREKVGRAWGT